MNKKEEQQIISEHMRRLQAKSAATVKGTKKASTRAADAAKARWKKYRDAKAKPSTSKKED